MEVPVTFAAGGVTLEGLVHVPATAPEIGVVVCHPHPLYGGNMHNNVVEGLLDAFQTARMATLRFNFRGVGASTGEHGGGDAELDDVTAAVTRLLEACSPSKVIVAGYSFGSIVGLRAGGTDARVHALIGVALPIARRDAEFLVGLAKPKLLISGDRDDISPKSMIEALHARCAEPKQLAIVTGADHFFAGLEAEVGRLAARFVAELQ